MTKTKVSRKPLKPKYRFNKLTIAVVVLLVAIVGGVYVFVTHASGPYIYLSPASASPYVGSTFTVKVYEQSGTTSVNAAEADIIIPAAKLAYVRTDATGSSFSLRGPVTLKNGVLSIPAASYTALTGNQLIATITIKATAAGSAPLNFAPASSIIRKVDAVNIISYTQGGTYTIKAAPTAATTMAIYPKTGSISYSNYHLVGVNIVEQSDAQPVNAFETNLTYPSNLVSYDHVIYGNGFSQGVLPSISGNTITITGVNIGGQLTGSQYLATVYFNIKAAGTANFGITHASQMINASTAKPVSIAIFGTASYLLKKP